MVVCYSITIPSFSATQVRSLFSLENSPVIVGASPQFDVHPDGERFVVVGINADGVIRELNVALNFFDTLREMDPDQQ